MPDMTTQKPTRADYFYCSGIFDVLDTRRPPMTQFKYHADAWNYSAGVKRGNAIEEIVFLEVPPAGEEDETLHDRD